MQCESRCVSVNQNLNFEPLMLKNKDLFYSYVRPCGYNHSEASFSNLYIWQHAWDIRMAVSGGALFVSMDSDIYRPLLVPPFVRDCDEPVLPYMLMCEEYMNDVYGGFYIKCATAAVVDKIRRDCGDRYRFSYDAYNSEYVYRTSDLIELRGKKYHSKRNHISAFIRKYGGEIEEYSPKYRDECLKLQKNWAKGKDFSEREIEEEYVSVLNALDNYAELGFKGCVVKVGGEVAAFSFGERINGDTAIIHIEKADSNYDGIYAFINREFAANFWSDATYINRAEDMGVPGIRKAKRSYHPAYMLDKYDVLLNRG